jgi:hypothetical protein
VQQSRVQNFMQQQTIDWAEGREAQKVGIEENIVTVRSSSG